MLQAGALLLLVVFGFKAALAPLALWLPATYAAASAPVAALFAIMTKVGVYAIVRVHGVVFGAERRRTGAGEPLLLPLALATSVLGVLGALASHTLPRLVAWLTVASVGTVLAAHRAVHAAAWSAALYYLVNSTLVVAGLFLLAETGGLAARRRGRPAGARPRRGAAGAAGPAAAAGRGLGGRPAAAAGLHRQADAAAGRGRHAWGWRCGRWCWGGLAHAGGPGARRQHPVLACAARLPACTSGAPARGCWRATALLAMTWR
jgi:hypothetical protein